MTYIISNLRQVWNRNMTPTNSRLSIYVFLLLFLTSIDYILNVRWITCMKNYTVISGSILFPLFGFIFFFIPTFYLHLTKKLNKTENNKVTRNDMIAMGSFDGLNALLATIPIPYLNLVVMSIVDKINLPLIALASFYWLGRRYKLSHYLGIFLTLYGILVSFIPYFMGNNIKCHIGWLFVYISNIISATASFVYKEKKLKEFKVDVWWMNCYICWYQLLIGCVFLPISIFADPNLTFSNFPQHMSDAFKCQFAGINSNPGDQCQYAFLWFVLFNLISIFANILLFLILREGSAVLFLIIKTLKTPITSYLASFSVLAGRSASPLTVADWYAFVMLIVAAIVYNHNSEMDIYGNPIRNNQNDETLPIHIPSDETITNYYDDDTLSLHSPLSVHTQSSDDDSKSIQLL